MYFLWWFNVFFICLIFQIEIHYWSVTSKSEFHYFEWFFPLLFFPFLSKTPMVKRKIKRNSLWELQNVHAQHIFWRRKHYHDTTLAFITENIPWQLPVDTYLITFDPINLTMLIIINQTLRQWHRLTFVSCSLFKY